MIIFGVVSNPLVVVKALQANGVRFSFNETRIFFRNVVFSSVFRLTTKAHTLGNRCVIVFDARERLETLQGINIIERDNLEYLLNFFLTRQSIGPPAPIQIKPVNHINERIEQNKSFGLMHRYQNNLYALKAKDLREQVRDLILGYASGATTREFILKVLNELYEARRNSATRDVVKNIYDLVADDEFTRVRQCLMHLLKIKGPLDNDYLESVCLNNTVEAYDVRYLFAVLTRNKG